MNPILAPRKRILLSPLLITLAVFLFLAAVGAGVWAFYFRPQQAWPKTPIRLATFEKSGVRVSLTLQPASNNLGLLTATFTPLQKGYHVYSKDLPRGGVNGLGRPTLLELPPRSRMQALGALQESIQATESVSADTPELTVYPPGPVTLSLPVSLPVSGSGNDTHWLDDQVSVTYMACSDRGCLQPVIGQLIPVKVPAISPLAATPSAKPEGYTWVSLYSENGNLPDQLQAEVKKALELGQKPFALFEAGWCLSCRKLEESLSNVIVRQAFEGTYIIHLDLDDWQTHLGGTGFSVDQIPEFIGLDEQGRPTRHILQGSAWGPDTPGAIAPVLLQYFNSSQ